MATFDYQGSIAQKYILFVTTIVTTSVPGANYSKVLIFIDNNDAATNFVAGSVPAVDTITTVAFQNYTSLLQGSMLAWLTGFYAVAANQVSTVYFVPFTNTGFSTGSSSADLGSQYLIFDQYAYFKLGYSSLYKQYTNFQLAALCFGDPLSQFLYGSNDATSITGVATERNWFKSTALAGVSLNNLDIPFLYHWNPGYNPALVQLGATLAVANATGTPVGNKTDYLAISGFGPSGSSATGPLNLTAQQALYAQGSNICFFTWVGDGSGNVVAERWWTCVSQTLFGAVWLRNYIDTVSSILTATFLTATPQSGFNNNDTYQCIINILKVQLNLFAGIGRLLNVTITAPPFTQLPAAVAGTITVPAAWNALYADNLRFVTIYGTLYIPAT